MTMGRAGCIARSFLTRSQPGMSSRSTSTTARLRRNRPIRRMASSPRAVGYARSLAWSKKLATSRAEASSPSATRIQRWLADSRKFMLHVESRFSARGPGGFEIEKLHEGVAGTLPHVDRIDGPWRTSRWPLDQTELLDPTVQRADGEAEGASGLLLVVAESFEGASDQIALGLIERR